jgi:hypothetical protein
MTTESKAITLKEPQALSTLGEVQQFAETCYKSGLFPDCKTPVEAVMKIVAGRELGIPALMSLQKLYIVNGRMGMAGEVAIVLLQRAGYKISHKYDSRDNPTACEVTISHPQKGNFSWRFTLADAKRAGLVKPNSAWEKFPQDLLYYRALMSCARKFAPEALGGIGYTPEELSSITIEAEETIPSSPENPLVSKAKEYGAVEIPNISKEFPKLLMAYPDLSLESCWVHHINWEDSEYGPRHDVPRCYLKNLLKDITQEISTKYLESPAFQEPQKRGDKIVRYQTTEWKGWLKKDCNIDNWNNLDVIEQLKVLERLIPAQPIE